MVLSMLISLVPSVYADVNVSDTVSEFSEVDFLTEVGLISEGFDISHSITRGELAKLVIEAFYPELDFSLSEGDPAFSDVTSDHPYYAYIKACKELKIVNGNGVNMFNPDNTVTAMEMITIMVNTLGYTIYADAYGGWPTGYYSIARETGISKNIDLGEEEISNGTAARIIYNALFADTVDLTSISKDGIEIEVSSNKNFLSDRLGIFEYDAVLVDNGYSSIYGDSINDNERVVFEDYSGKSLITAFSNGHNVYDYLGMRVKVFIRNNKESGRYELVYIAPNKRIKVANLDAGKIINFNSDYIEYDEDENTSDIEKYSLESIAPKIIYNGSVMVSVSLSDIMPKEGFVKLIDNDSNNRYDVIDITSFNYNNGNYKATSRNIVVDKVVAEEGEEYISSLFNPQASLRLDSDKAIYKFKLSGNIDTLAEITTYDVVSVAECPEKIGDKTLYYLVVCRKEYFKVADDLNLMAELRDFHEKKGSKIFYDWKPFEHPELGEVEIGGFIHGRAYYMHPDTLGKVVPKTTDFIKKHIALRPKLKLDNVCSKVAENNMLKITATLTNEGEMGTTVMKGSSGELSKIPVKVYLTEGTRSDVIDGNIRYIDCLDAHQKISLEWIIERKDVSLINIIAEHPKTKKAKAKLIIN